jgi:hypothetical protein
MRHDADVANLIQLVFAFHVVHLLLAERLLTISQVSGVSVVFDPEFGCLVAFPASILPLVRTPGVLPG